MLQTKAGSGCIKEPLEQDRNEDQEKLAHGVSFLSNQPLGDLDTHVHDFCLPQRSAHLRSSMKYDQGHGRNA